jgi:hypothetical protein
MKITTPPHHNKKAKVLNLRKSLSDAHGFVSYYAQRLQGIKRMVEMLKA